MQLKYKQFLLHTIVYLLPQSFSTLSFVQPIKLMPSNCEKGLLLPRHCGFAFLCGLKLYLSRLVVQSALVLKLLGVVSCHLYGVNIYYHHEELASQKSLLAQILLPGSYGLFISNGVKQIRVSFTKKMMTTHMDNIRSD